MTKLLTSLCLLCLSAVVVFGGLMFHEPSRAAILGLKTETTNGVDGKSAYDLAVENGFEGTLQEWLDSLKSADGQNGNDCGCDCCIAMPYPIYYFDSDEMIAVHELPGISYFVEIIVPITSNAQEIVLSKDPDLNEVITFLVEHDTAMISSSGAFGWMFDYCQHNAEDNTYLYLSITYDGLRLINGMTLEVVIEIANDFFPLDSEFYLVRQDIGEIIYG